MYRRILARTALFAAVCAALAAPTAAARAEPGPPAAPPAAGAPAAERALFVPAANPAAAAQARELAVAGRRAEAEALTAMATTPHAVWLGDQAPARAEAEARETARTAARRGTLPVFALYNVPGRDCSQYSAGGADGSAAYRAWIDAVARGIGDHRAVIVLEPDSLALLPHECAAAGAAAGSPGEFGGDLARARTDARYAEIRYAVATLEARPGADVYLDTGHAGWHTVDSIVPRLRDAGIDRATGFAVNVSNYHPDAANSWFATLVSACLAYADKGGNTADCPDQRRPRREAEQWLATRLTDADRARMKHYVTDSSRNGRGVWSPAAGKYRDPQDWCNPPGRGLGARPTTVTGDRLHDAKLWIKIPGESDGACLRGTAGPRDPERGVQDPPAGVWFPEQALELARLANPALMG
ncbi:glycoside hydrolase family 6 protein [Streptomyces sp. NPDC091259]|uniref:glycoside hydrolase family 6 protein n=1 Tax=Streptomyces sp. NPDC091259 TaxID=3365976 RepID=UPI0037FF400B